MNFDYKRMLKFEHNVGAQDKKYRMIAGCALLLIAIVTAKIVLLLLGMVLVITAYSGWCPLYSGLGKNTSCGACHAADNAAEQANDATEQTSEVIEQASEATPQK